MAFTDEVVAQAFTRSGGRCECSRAACPHSGRCAKTFAKGDRARSDETGWQANHRTASSVREDDSLSNCEILCVPCHKRTGTYGRS